MIFKISPDGRTLTVIASENEREQLRQMKNLQADETLYQFFEHIVCRSGLNWLNPADTGDLTDAPILGILGETQPANSKTLPSHHGVVFVGHYGEPPQDQVQPIIERWAFMDYQLRSPLEALRDKGEAVFINGK